MTKPEADDAPIDWAAAHDLDGSEHAAALHAAAKEDWKRYSAIARGFAGLLGPHRLEGRANHSKNWWWAQDWGFSRPRDLPLWDDGRDLPDDHRAWLLELWHQNRMLIAEIEMAPSTVEQHLEQLHRMLTNIAPARKIAWSEDFKRPYRAGVIPPLQHQSGRRAPARSGESFQRRLRIQEKATAAFIERLTERFGETAYGAPWGGSAGRNEGDGFDDGDGDGYPGYPRAPNSFVSWRMQPFYPDGLTIVTVALNQDAAEQHRGELSELLHALRRPADWHPPLPRPPSARQSWPLRLRR